MKLTFPRLIMLAGISVVCMAFASAFSPQASPVDPGLYGVISFDDVGIEQAFKDFDTYAAVVPAPTDLNEMPTVAAVADPEMLSPVYRLAWKTDAHNLISPHLRC